MIFLSIHGWLVGSMLIFQGVPILGESNSTQMYGSFEGFPLNSLLVPCLGWQRKTRLKWWIKFQLNWVFLHCSSEILLKGVNDEILRIEYTQIWILSSHISRWRYFFSTLQLNFTVVWWFRAKTLGKKDTLKIGEMIQLHFHIYWLAQAEPRLKEIKV